MKYSTCKFTVVNKTVEEIKKRRYDEIKKRCKPEDFPTYIIEVNTLLRPFGFKSHLILTSNKKRTIDVIVLFSLWCAMRDFTSTFSVCRSTEAHSASLNHMLLHMPPASSAYACALSGSSPF